MTAKQTGTSYPFTMNKIRRLRARINEATGDELRDLTEQLDKLLGRYWNGDTPKHHS